MFQPKFRFVATSLVAFFLIVLLSLPAPLPAAVEPDEFDQNRARLLSYVLRRQLENHFSNKPIDDQLSKVAFGLYLKQLDYQKRLLLAAEVEQLRIFETRIDDEISSGRVVLAPLGARLLENSIHRAEKIVAEILSQPFDFSVAESYETDPEKLEFCATEEELRDRWRTDLKFRVLNRYLGMVEDEALGDPGKLAKNKQSELEIAAREKVAGQYEDYFGRLLKETVKDHYDRYLNSFARAFDPHTGYMPPQSKEDFDISMRGSLEGIGATLREEDGYIRVVKIIPGSAADRQGELHADDVILAVGEGGGDPVDITDMRLRDAVSLIRGKKGTEVRLTVRRAGHKPMTIPIVRDVVIIEESFVKSTLILDPESDSRFGYIKIPSFYRDFENTRNGGEGRNSTDDVKKALKALTRKKITGLILDLRNNGGGALTDAVGITGLFIEKGPVVQVRDGDDQTKVLYDHDSYVGYDGPMVVLVNQFSASASEIVAGALQDYGRAVVIGSEHTHGKGTVQVIMDLDKALTLRNMREYMPLGALKMTTQKFYRINGSSTQYRGVEPDIVLPDRNRSNKFGERYLDYSLPWDTIKSVDYANYSLGSNLVRLSELSRQRVAANEEFAEIERLAELTAQRIANTRQSLKLEDVYRERNDMFGGADNPHARSMYDGPDIDADRDDKESAEDRTLTETQKLLKAVSKDPYVTESMAILSDLLRERELQVAGNPG
ncbi:MAG: carboxy terminal-processing peptidase [Desulfuromonadales bacterium]|nr:carboxy terminal-processing peptidase [Desulfuromonadales bacterium]